MLTTIPSATMVTPSRRLKSFWTYKVSWPHDTQRVTVWRPISDSLMKTSNSRLQFEQVTRDAGEGSMTTSLSQCLHRKCIVGIMKPIIVMLLLAISVQAQTLADIARQERERRAKLKPTRVITGEGVRPTAPAVEGSKPGEARPAEAKPAVANEGDKAANPAATDKPATATEKSQAAPAQPAPAPPAPAKPDPAAAYNAELEKLRSRIRELQDQETTLQLQINQLTNQIFAPITDQASKDQAQARLGEVQQRLTSTRAELDQSRRTLDSLQLQGPPKQ